jgi:DUF917 family protein
VDVGFQNEFLVAREGDALRAVTPDLLIVVEADTLQPITTERLRFGQRVTLIGVEAPPQLRTEEALALVGPRAFSLDMDYEPLATLPGNAPLAV